MPQHQLTYEDFIRSVREFLSGGRLYPVHIDVTLNDGTHFTCPLDLFPHHQGEPRATNGHAEVVDESDPSEPELEILDILGDDKLTEKQIRTACQKSRGHVYKTLKSLELKGFVEKLDRGLYHCTD